MAAIVLDTEAARATPAAGQSIIFPENVLKRWMQKDDAGNLSTLSDIANGSSVAVATPGSFSVDTYLAGSSMQIARGLPKNNTTYRCRFDMVKTAAGVAGFVIVIRYGTAGTTADTIRVTLTFAAGTAAIDTGIFEVFAHFRNVGGAAVLVAMARCTHHLAATGLISTGASGIGIILANSAGFDSTPNDSIIGLSINGGAAFSGTNTLVESELVNG